MNLYNPATENNNHESTKKFKFKISKGLLATSILIIIALVTIFRSEFLDLQNLVFSNAQDLNDVSTPIEEKRRFKSGELLIVVNENTISVDSNKFDLDRALKGTSNLFQDIKVNQLPIGEGFNELSSQQNEGNQKKVYLLEFNEEIPIENAIDEIRKIPNISHVQPNYKYELSQENFPDDPYFNDIFRKNESSRDPDWDPKYNYQWNLQEINADKAWDIEKGSSEVLIAVIDSGIDYNHEDLQGKVILGKDYYNFDDDPMDDFGHGTHVAGIIAANTNNGIGMSSVCPECKLYASKAFDQYGSAFTSHIIQAIYDAVYAGARVINASFGGYGNDPLLEESIAYATQQNVVFVAAAGNDAVPAADSIPANYDCSEYLPTIDCVLTVGASNQGNELANYSNYGDFLDVIAPGGDLPPQYNIISTKSELLYEGLNDFNINEKYLRLSGTSMATPHVSGMAGLIISKDPSLTEEEVRYIIMNSTGNKKVKPYNKSRVGLINLYKALTEMDKTPPKLIAERNGTKVNFPQTGMLVNKNFEIRGTMAGDGFNNFTVEIKLPNAKTWTKEGIKLVNGGKTPIYENKLANISINNIRDNKVFEVKLRINNNLANVTYTKDYSIYVNNSIRTGFPFGYTGFQKFNIADINEDGKDEILFSDLAKGRLNALDYSGSQIPGWPVITNDIGGLHYDSERRVLVSDTHEDLPGKEVYLSVDPNTIHLSRIGAYQSNGVVITDWSNGDWPTHRSNGFSIRNNMVIDKSNNGVASIIYDWTKQIPEFNLGYFKLPDLPIKADLEKDIDALAIGDLNCDASNEIIAKVINSSFVKQESSLVVLKNKNEVLTTITLKNYVGSVERVFTGNPLLVDFDNNGDHEIISAFQIKYAEDINDNTFDRIEDFIGIWNEQGDLLINPIKLYTYEGRKTRYSHTTSLTPVNLDNDPELELVTLSSIDYKKSLFQAHNMDGSMVPGFKKTMMGYLDSSEERNLRIVTLSEGKVLFVSNLFNKIIGYVYDKNTKSLSSEPLINIIVPATKKTEMSFFSQISLADLEKDGKLEIISAMIHGGGSIISMSDVYPDLLYVFDTGLNVENFDWSLYGKDSESTFSVPSSFPCQVAEPTPIN